MYLNVSHVEVTSAHLPKISFGNKSNKLSSIY